jgi:hypothetical protein
MPLGPLRAACVRPAPKSRSVVFGLLRIKITSGSEGEGEGEGGSKAKYADER